VAVANQHPEARSLIAWLRHGWHVALGYAAGIAVMVLLEGS
jgi:hypothetical protein